MIVPNTERVLIRRIDQGQTQSGVLLAGQLKAGENLFFGEVVHPGDTKFHKGQKVYYSEYSAAQIYYIEENKNKSGTMQTGGTNVYVVAEDDIMAYNEDEPETESTEKPKALKNS